MPKTSGAASVRRSVALPAGLVEQAMGVAPPEAETFNRVVIIALREFAERRKRQAFETAMGQMAADPAIQTECAKIRKSFRTTEQDGLKHD
jgi:hypothetical protein